MRDVDVEALKDADSAVFFEQTAGVSPDKYQRQILEYKGSRLILNCTRQWGKSLTVAGKAYRLAKYNSGFLALILCPSLRQSTEIFRKILHMSAEDKTALKKIEDSKQYVTMANGSRIISLPDKEGTIRTYSGVDLIIIDEASKVSEELFYAVLPMLAVSGGALYLMSSPYGKRGFFHREWTNGDAEWQRYQITARRDVLSRELLQGLSPPPLDAVSDECMRIPEKHLIEVIHKMPLQWFLQEYYCEFTEPEYQLIPYDLIKAALVDGVEPFRKDVANDEIRPFFR